MKFSTTLIVLLVSLNAHGQTEVSIGMTVDEVSKIYPDSDVSRSANNIFLKRPESINGLNGTWNFRFVDGVLDWISWSVYINEVSESNFEKTLTAVRGLNADFAHKYGDPSLVRIGDISFKDPYKRLHYGYDVIETRWNDWQGMKIGIKFRFRGGKGDYQYVVTVDYSNKDDPN